MVAAAVILDPRRRIRGIRDSKAARARGARGARDQDPRARARLVGRLGRRRRDRLPEHPAGDVSRDAPRADRLAHSARRTCRSTAIAARRSSGCRWSARFEAIIDGDALRTCIGAASILAKVTRDAMMVGLDALYPQYGFAVAQGLQHAAALRGARRLRTDADPSAQLRAGAARLRARIAAA